MTKKKRYIYIYININKFIQSVFMKDFKDRKRVRPTRHRFFKMKINLGIILDFSRIPKTSLVDILLSSNFVSQKILETTLYNLKIPDRDRLVYLKNFNGQLQCDPQGVPFWNVYLQTTALVTSRSVAKRISKELFNIEDSIAPTISVSHLSHFKQCARVKLFSITESDFYPGYFSRTLLRFEELLKNEQIKEAIKERPKKYWFLTDTEGE